MTLRDTMEAAARQALGIPDGRLGVPVGHSGQRFRNLMDELEWAANCLDEHSKAILDDLVARSSDPQAQAALGSCIRRAAEMIRNAMSVRFGGRMDAVMGAEILSRALLEHDAQ